MPRMITLLLDQGLGENGKTEKWAPLFSKKIIFCFSSFMVTQGSSTLMLSGAWTGDPRAHQSIGGSTPPSIWVLLDLQWLLLQRGQHPRGGRGCLLGCPPFGHSLQKCPFCPQWYHTQPSSGGALPESCNEVIVFFNPFLSF
jgi:hypothetical protein